MKYHAVFFLFPFAALFAQEADHGIDLRATVTAQVLDTHDLSESPRDGSPLIAGFRSVLYPTWKLSDHWDVSGAVQVASRPFFYDDFHSQGYGVRARILQLNLRYVRLWNRSSIIIRGGQMATAFGTFSLRYDDSVNPVVGTPMQYGYSGVSNAALTAVQADVTWTNWDARIQLSNSSPLNPRSVFAKDQYGNWAVGLGYTIRQGLRVGMSAFRGPYLDRQSRYFFHGESKPSDLPATAGGVDLEWAAGHWNLDAELQRFEFNYHVIPTYHENAGYVEVKRVLHPRLYLAVRSGFLHSSFHSGGETYEIAVGFRPDSHQLIKASYALERDREAGALIPLYSLQLVTILHPLSLAWR